MADDARISQHVIEFLAPNIVNARIEQHVVEIAAPPLIESRIEQHVVEILAPITVLSRISQNIIEIIMPGIPDVSGIYFINPKKAEWHDSYYGDRTDPGNPGPGVERKIPDPTIRLPLIGD
jgi:hypothetical protein